MYIILYFTTSLNCLKLKKKLMNYNLMMEICINIMSYIYKKKKYKQLKIQPSPPGPPVIILSSEPSVGSPIVIPAPESWPLCITPSTVKLSLTSFGIVTCVEPLKAAGFPVPAPIAGGGILKSLIGPSSTTTTALESSWSRGSTLIHITASHTTTTSWITITTIFIRIFLVNPGLPLRNLNRVGKFNSLNRATYGVVSFNSFKALSTLRFPKFYAYSPTRGGSFV
ncbi:hypothetical protein AGLY_001564 [Aphis glycines]|uniref:Uncharacterized protein n=1 Tax=Aphis glycines TaxID=307491 RepID=A0A6G0U5I7_APHGL|nr:hypothetical protein AGLY_001564 [Aphis glycines]